MKDKGFTIVELLVVIVIVSLFIIIVISNFPQIRLQFALSRVAYKFNQDLRRAQNLASSTVQFKDSLGTIQSVNGYGVYVDMDALGNKKYIIYADKPTGSTTINAITYPTSNQYYDNADYSVETIDLSITEPGIIIKEIDTPTTSSSIGVNFNSSDLATTIEIPQLLATKNSVDIVFAIQTDPTKTKTVSVNHSGSIVIK